METANSIFVDNYLKKLKRPELQGIYKPDDNYGANMLFRSNETNPWAGRDQSNARYGYLGGPAGTSGLSPGYKLPTSNTGTSGEASSIMPGLNMPGGWNIPGMPSAQKSTFTSLMEPVVGAGSQLGAKAIVDWMKGPQTLADLSPMMEGYAKNALGVAAGMESGLGGFDKLLGGAIEKSTGDLAASSGDLLSKLDPTSAAVSAVPMLAQMFGLKSDSDASRGLSAATSVGLAAAQGGLNPISDIAAVVSLIKLFGGLFG